MAPVLEFKTVNKTQQVYNYVEGLIKKNVLCPGDCIMPESKLAEKLNVGLITVRRAMSLLVDSGLVYRVQGKGTFVAKTGKEREMSSKLSCIATLFPYSLDGADLKTTLLGIQHHLKIGNYSNFVHFGADNTGLEEAESIESMIAKGVRGFIIYPAADQKSKENIIKLNENKIPYVLLDKYFDGIESNYAGIDETDGALQLIENLSIKHKRIGFITHNLKHSSNRARFDGYLNAINKFCLPYDPTLIWNNEQYSLLEEEAGYRGMTELLQIENPPTAVLAVNCSVACGAERAIREHVKDTLGKEISIASFDYSNTLKNYFHSTYLVWPRYEIGKRALMLLHKQINDETVMGVHVKLKTTLNIINN